MGWTGAEGGVAVLDEEKAGRLREKRADGAYAETAEGWIEGTFRCSLLTEMTEEEAAKMTHRSDQAAGTVGVSSLGTDELHHGAGRPAMEVEADRTRKSAEWIRWSRGRDSKLATRDCELGTLEELRLSRECAVGEARMIKMMQRTRS